jgi:hypothetical protein
VQSTYAFLKYWMQRYVERSVGIGMINVPALALKTLA